MPSISRAGMSLLPAFVLKPVQFSWIPRLQPSQQLCWVASLKNGYQNQPVSQDLDPYQKSVYTYIMRISTHTPTHTRTAASVALDNSHEKFNYFRNALLIGTLVLNSTCSSQFFQDFQSKACSKFLLWFIILHS